MSCKVECKIRYNHVGYGVKFPKRFFVAVPAVGESACGSNMRDYAGARFVVVGESGALAFEGTLAKRGFCDYTREMVYEGDFSNVAAPGKYKIKVFLGSDEGTLCLASHEFSVSDEWFSRQLMANIKSFYFQRSGVALPVEKAGKWARPAAHLDDCIAFHAIMNREGTWNAHGGWYDAGDYGKYIVNGGVSVGTLLLACEMCPPEPTLLEEIRFELDFFLRMQDADGGVFFKVTPGHWDGFMMPVDSDVMQKRFIMGKSTSSTLNFAGALAQAHRVFQKLDPDYAARCLAASRRAYEWAVQNPDADWPHNTEGSGGYGDEHVEDEFFWARAMLYRESRDPALRAQLPGDMLLNPVQPCLSWRDTHNFGWMALALLDAPSGADADLQKNARTELERISAEIVNLHEADAYGLSIRKFVWGSNGEIANHALTLLVTYSWTRDPKLLNTAMELVHFVYGRNPVDTSFVTGSAWSSPMHPHHRICHSDGVEEPIPGLLVGGLNNDRQDLHRMAHYSSDLPGFAYTDERCSFASNETAINWNAPLTAALALIRYYSLGQNT
ncbi:glycoside hydrolase family 9 protein [Fibrobacter sp. UWP2]|uniref:glycoside hydrolase family 9 protein n=1 Tax=Fibrobacter sp. UWP2 TaxID=1896216 RepID=UPI00092205A4|nr:glycoside hydrolase family 9 protein [Fibrobacter sp. UWP2]SHI58833.1 endoglucanase [Fibrobacter sp. UWP2]